MWDLACNVNSEGVIKEEHEESVGGVCLTLMAQPLIIRLYKEAYSIVQAVQCEPQPEAV